MGQAERYEQIELIYSLRCRVFLMPVLDSNTTETWNSANKILQHFNETVALWYRQFSQQQWQSAKHVFQYSSRELVFNPDLLITFYYFTRTGFKSIEHVFVLAHFLLENNKNCPSIFYFPPFSLAITRFRQSWIVPTTCVIFLLLIPVIF